MIYNISVETDYRNAHQFFFSLVQQYPVNSVSSSCFFLLDVQKMQKCNGEDVSRCHHLKVRWLVTIAIFDLWMTIRILMLHTLQTNSTKANVKKNLLTKKHVTKYILFNVYMLNFHIILLGFLKNVLMYKHASVHPCMSLYSKYMHNMPW